MTPMSSIKEVTRRTNARRRSDAPDLRSDDYDVAPPSSRLVSARSGRTWKGRTEECARGRGGRGHRGARRAATVPWTWTRQPSLDTKVIRCSRCGVNKPFFAFSAAQIAATDAACKMCEASDVSCGRKRNGMEFGRARVIGQKGAPRGSEAPWERRVRPRYQDDGDPSYRLARRWEAINEPSAHKRKSVPIVPGTALARATPRPAPARLAHAPASSRRRSNHDDNQSFVHPKEGRVSTQDAAARIEPKHKSPPQLSYPLPIEMRNEALPSSLTYATNHSRRHPVCVFQKGRCVLTPPATEPLPPKGDSCRFFGFVRKYAEPPTHSAPDPVEHTSEGVGVVDLTGDDVEDVARRESTLTAGVEENPVLQPPSKRCAEEKHEGTTARNRHDCEEERRCDPDVDNEARRIASRTAQGSSPHVPIDVTNARDVMGRGASEKSPIDVTRDDGTVSSSKTPASTFVSTAMCENGRRTSKSAAKRSCAASRQSTARRVFQPVPRKQYRSTSATLDEELKDFA